MSPSTSNVLLVAANRETFPEPVFPVGLLYTACAFESAGASVRVFDAGRNLFPLRGLLKELSDHPPDVVGFSLRNVDNAAWPSTRTYLPGYLELTDALRRSPWGRSRPDLPLYLGGPAFSLFPDELLASLGAKGGVVGDAEGAAEWILGGGRGVFRTPRLSPVSVSLPVDRAPFFPGLRRYPAIGVQTARGCGFRCLYCTYPVLEGGAFRPRDPVEVVDELEVVTRRFGTRRIFLVDSALNTDEGHATAVLREIVARRLRLRFSCYLQPRVVDPAFFRLLRDAGCIAVDFGTESGSPHSLAALGKVYKPDDIRAASDACRDAGIDFCHSLLFGAPGEDAASIAETVALMDETRPRAVVAMVGIRIYPGTGIERVARSEGKVPEAASLLAPAFYFPDGGGEALAKEVRRQVGSRRNWFFPGEIDWSGSLAPRLLRLVHRDGPLWRTFRR